MVSTKIQNSSLSKIKPHLVTTSFVRSFGNVKKQHVHIVFLALLLIAPLVMPTIYCLDNNDNTCEAYENTSEEEQSEEKDAEEEKETEDVNEFELYKLSLSITVTGNKNNYYVKKEIFNSFYSEVLTPPPDLS